MEFRCTRAWFPFPSEGNAVFGSLWPDDSSFHSEDGKIRSAILCNPRSLQNKATLPWRVLNFSSPCLRIITSTTIGPFGAVSKSLKQQSVRLFSISGNISRNKDATVNTMPFTLSKTIPQQLKSELHLFTKTQTSSAMLHATFWSRDSTEPRYAVKHNARESLLHLGAEFDLFVDDR